MRLTHTIIMRDEKDSDPKNIIIIYIVSLLLTDRRPQ